MARPCYDRPTLTTSPHRRSRPANGVRPDDLVFVPLGGVGEIGMNVSLYGHADRWLLVDCGISFDNTRGQTDLLRADLTFIEQQRRNLVGLVITHAHEDHLGAVTEAWEDLRCPVFATPFSAEVLRRKLHDTRRLHQVPLVEIPASGRVSLPPFDVRFVPVTHSTLECNALVIETPLGTVVHTGDFKIDDDPRLGALTDASTLKLVGERGVLAVVSDSTNATKPGRTPSEGALRPALIDLLTRPKGRVAVASFASNVARITTLVEAATAVDRHPIFVGRSMLRMIDVARATGYAGEFPGELDARDAGYLPPDKVLLICTGTQGEHDAALSRISRDEHRDVFLERGDTVVFSSKIIPGNEAPIAALHGRLRRLAVEVVSEKGAFVHVSGHPAQEDLALLYSWLRPQTLVPVHGEARHLAAHEELGARCGVEQTVVPFDGAVVRLAPGAPAIVGKIRVGRLRRVRERWIRD